MSVTILNGDVRDVLLTLPAESVQCCVTSPPYYGLRDYGTAQWNGGDAACDHVATANRDGRPRCGLTGGTATVEAATIFRATCGKCGATRVDSQIGLEPSPDAYVAEMVAVFREVRRVLRPDGVLFLNLGDSYCNPAQSGGGDPTIGTRNLGGVRQPKGAHYSGIKPKDLMMIPARVALALQADGWWLRSDIIWAKPNPMPESVTDRPTSAHEHVFLLTKSARYFWDADAVREPHDSHGGGGLCNKQTLKTVIARVSHAPSLVNAAINPDGRNIRNVWTIATQPFSEAHFAVFPAELAERCIKAGSKPGDTILDPFAGAFTAPMVADRLQRNAIGIELNADYCDMARRRLVDDGGMFMELAG